MATVTVNKIAGLHTSPNETGSVPEGALVQADNVSIRNKDVLEPRRGFANQSYTFGDGTTQKANEVFFYNGTLLVHYGTSSLARDTGAAYSAYSGTHTPPDATLLRMKGVEAQQSFYFTTTTGVKVLDSVSGTPAAAGIPAATDPQGLTVTVSGGAGNWLDQDYQAAYRCVWGKIDANDRMILGRPSGRTKVVNTGAEAYVSGAVPAIPDVSSDYFYRVYRAESSPDDLEPSEDTYLVYEGRGNSGFTASVGTIQSVNASDHLVVTRNNHGYKVYDRVYLTLNASESVIEFGGHYRVSAATTNTFTLVGDDPTNGVLGVDGVNSHAATITPVAFGFVDYTPDEMLGDPLYTNPSDGDGDANGNEPPPIAKDIALWNERLWYANTTGRQRYTLSMLGVGAPDGVQDGDTIEIDGHAYFFETTPTTEVGVQVTTSGTPGENVATTARDLVKAINRNPNTTIRAYYVSGVNDVPGKIVLEDESLGASAFVIEPTRATSWNPYISTTDSSTNDAAPNRVYYSKYQQPEAVPLLNYIDIGSKNKPILRILALRDKLYVLKEDGIYIVSGEAPFRVDLLDDTIKLLSPDSAVTVGNQIFALTYQGVVAISDAGVRIVSRPIENDLVRWTLSSTIVAAVKTYAFGVSYESERSYILALPYSDGSIEYLWVYNYLTNTWTNWLYACRCGRVSPAASDALYLGTDTYGKIAVERKTMTRADYRDNTTATTVNAVTSLGSGSYTLTLNAPVSALGSGDVIECNGGAVALVTDPNTSTPTVLVTSGTPATGAATISHGYEVIVAWAANPGGSPSIAKHYREAAYLFKRRLFYSNYATFSTDLQTDGSVPLTWTGRTIATSGSLTTRALPVNIRAIVPQSQQRGSYLQVGFRIQEAYAFWESNGFALELDGASERGTR